MNKLDLDLLYHKLDIRRQQWGLTWAQMSAQSGVSSTTRIRLAQGTEPSAEDMTKLRIWLREWAGRCIEPGEGKQWKESKRLWIEPVLINAGVE